MDTVFVIKEKNSYSYTSLWSQWQYLTVTEFKMFVPMLQTRMKKRSENRSERVKRSNIGTFIPIAMKTCCG